MVYRLSRTRLFRSPLKRSYLRSAMHNLIPMSFEIAEAFNLIYVIVSRFSENCHAHP